MQRKFLPWGGFFLILLAVSHYSQSSVPFTDQYWAINGTNLTFEKIRGFDSVYADDGLAVLKDVEFLNGTIEFDVFMEDVFSFPGVRFRIQDDLNYEEFYLRPFESGKDDATQYSPVFNGISGWQFYAGKGFAEPHKLRLNEWFHVKIVVRGNYGEVYFGGEKTPAMKISDLKRDPRSGKLGLKLSKAHFANFSYTADPRTVRTNQVPPFVLENGVPGAWLISTPISEDLLLDQFELKEHLTGPLSWNKLSAENKNGLINIARIRKKDGETNTVLAKLLIRSEKDQIKKLSIGFSDRVRIYFDNQLIFSGNDGFRTRDFRFLGTIGFFDSFYLRLRKGENVFVAAVSEDFGGWGIQAKFEDPEGLSFD